MSGHASQHRGSTKSLKPLGFHRGRKSTCAGRVAEVLMPVIVIGYAVFCFIMAN